MAIKKCGCRSDRNGSSLAAKYQDAIYGAGNRICNEKDAGGFRCTVCGCDVSTLSKKKK